jgi:HD-GYP domain-containing protein (c-di-GMP phosphodiesterase class II)
MVAVIDSWDAMRSDRPYRKALPREVAEAELRRGAGTQFDPNIVEAFLRIEDEEARTPPPREAPQS